jgi:hypothetical protein
MGSKSDKISIRITPNQSLVLAEMSQALGVSYSMLIRTILGDWIAKNEEYLEKIIDKKSLENANNQQN